MKATATDTRMVKQLEEEMKQGIAASESGDKAAAEAIFRRIVDRSPDALEAWVWLGWTSTNVDDAEVAFKRASVLDPSNEEAQLGLRWVASQRDAHNLEAPVEPSQVVQAGAAPTTTPTLEQGPPNAATRTTAPVVEDAVASGANVAGGVTLQQGIDAVQAGNKEGAYVIFKEMAQRNPESAETWVWLGGTCTDLDEAEAAFKRAGELDPQSEGAILGLRWVALRRRALEETRPATAVAAAETVEAVAKEPEAPQEKVGFFAKLFKKVGLVGLLLILTGLVVWGALLTWLIMTWTSGV